MANTSIATPRPSTLTSAAAAPPAPPGSAHELISKSPIARVAMPAGAAAAHEFAEQSTLAAALGEELATLRTALDQAEQGDGLAPWRRVFNTKPAEGGHEAIGSQISGSAGTIVSGATATGATSVSASGGS